MTVVLIKRECDRHPGCFMLTDKCERCLDEGFREELAALADTFLRRFAEAVSRAGDTETAT